MNLFENIDFGLCIFFFYLGWLIVTNCTYLYYKNMNRKDDWFLKTLLFPFERMGQFVLWLIVGSDYSNYDNVSIEEKGKKDKEFYETFKPKTK